MTDAIRLIPAEPVLDRLAAVEQRLDERATETPDRRRMAVGYLPEEEAAEVLGIGRTTLRAIRRRGEIGFSKHCGRVLYRIDDLRQYLDARWTPPRKRRLRAAS